MAKKIKKVKQASVKVYSSTKMMDKLVKAIETATKLTPSSNVSFNHHSLKSGSYVIDLITGGGYPCRRISSIYGPEKSGKTTASLETAAIALKNGLFVLYYDHENALDISYAARIFRKHGIEDVSFLIGNKKSKHYPQWRLYQPDSSEQTFMFIKSMLLSLPKEKPGPARLLIIIDSMANMKSEKVMEQVEGGEGQAGPARDFSNNLPSIKSAAGKRNVIVIALNQVRMKPGVMFGCFQQETPVTMADGTQKSIGEIVSTKDKGPVLSYDKRLEIFVPKPITGWYNNGEASGLWIAVSAEGPHGITSFTATPNHKVFVVAAGYAIKEVSVAQLRRGDRMVSWDESGLSTTKYPISVEVKTLHIQSATCKARTKFDIRVAGNSNYLVGGSHGVLVHNSPEYEPGGNSLKHNTDLRLRTSSSTPKESAEEGKMSSNMYLDVKKSKVFIPFLKAQTGLRVGIGFDRVSDICNYFMITDQWTGGEGGHISAQKDKRLKPYAGMSARKGIKKKIKKISKIIESQFESRLCYTLVKEHFKVFLEDLVDNVEKKHKKHKKNKSSKHKNKK